MMEFRPSNSPSGNCKIMRRGRLVPPATAWKNLVHVAGFSLQSVRGDAPCLGFSRRAIFQYSVIPLLLFLLAGCTKHFSSTGVGNVPPKTFVSAFPYRDSTQTSNFNPQSSRLEIHWWANDPDGLVAGYIITFNRKTWTFTTKNDSVFFLPLFSKDTNYVFTVAAIDNSFKGQLNEGDTVAFTDKNGNGVWDKGEVFPSLGTSVDPDPPSVKFPIANTPPTVQFVMSESPWVTRLDIPDTTFTVVTFGWEGTDIDGSNTIINYFIALNDTSAQSWVQLPHSSTGSRYKQGSRKQHTIRRR